MTIPLARTTAIILFPLALFCLTTAKQPDAKSETFFLYTDQDTELSFRGNSGKLKAAGNSLATDLVKDKTRIAGSRVQVTVAQSVAKPSRRPFTLLGQVYTLEPAALRFETPALLTLPYTNPHGYPEDSIHIYYYNPEEDRYQVMPKVAQDTDAKTITVAIDHFSDYLPGVDGFTVNEGLSPNAAYFRNNTERVDPKTGTLHLDKTDVSIQARGVDLTLESAFSSDQFFRNYQTGREDWEWSSFLEETHPYGIAPGWRFKLPAIVGYNGAYHLVTPSGTFYSLTSPFYCSNKETLNEVNTIHTVEGYRFYNTLWYPGSKAGTFYWLNYDRTVEIVAEKIVLTATITADWWTDDHVRNVRATLADGRIIEFHDLTDTDPSLRGKVKRIYDPTGTNYVQFSYTSGGALSRITHTDGRALEFE